MELVVVDVGEGSRWRAEIDPVAGGREEVEDQNDIPVRRTVVEGIAAVVSEIADRRESEVAVGIVCPAK